MSIEIPYGIGDWITVDGQRKKIVSMHIYVTANGEVLSYRFYLGDGKWITIPREVV